jgi:hypothetical protein
MSCKIKRILQLQEAIQYSNIQLFDGYNKDITNECQYSWSTDMICWTGWASINNYNDSCKNIEGDFYLRVLLNGSFDRILLNNSAISCYNICLDNYNTFLQDFCGNTNLYQPYNNLDCALQLQQQLSDSIICMFGLPVYYIRINPNKDTVDYTFKEYFLHYVDSVKQIKLMIPDGQMPSSNPKLTEIDFDWEIDWETEIGKSQFATAFGDEAYPKTGDLVYIPMMNRMWEVNAAYDEKNEGLMWRSTTWKLALVKYVDATNVDTGDFTELIDNWTSNTYQSVFGDIEKIEQERQVGASPISSPRFAATNLYDIFMEDAVRKQYTKQDITIIDKAYNNRSTIVSRNQYKFKNENGCIVYQNSICGDCGTLMFIVETNGTLNGKLERDIMNFGNVQVNVIYDEITKNYTIKYNDLNATLLPFKSYLVVLKWNRVTFSIEMNIYNYTHPENVPVYKLRPEMYYFDYENPVYSEVGVYNNDFVMEEPQSCQIHSYPLNITNIKYYNKYLGTEEGIKESIKYTTKHENCVINDLARPINSGHGYAVK